MKKKISLIIPTYKLSFGSNLIFFKDLIRWVNINQKTSTVFSLHEIILINDSPEDFPIAEIDLIFEEFGLKSILTYQCNTENRGQAFCRNKGADMASGDYLHFIDQDDYLLADFYNNIPRTNAELIMADLWFNINGLKEKSYYKPWTKLILSKTKDFRVLKFLLFSNIAVSPGQYLINNDLFREVGKFPDLKNKGSDDFGLLFNLSCVKREVKFSFVSKSKFVYRIHPNQGSKTLVLKESVNEFFKSRSFVQRLSVMHKLIRYVRTKSNLAFFNTLFYLLFFNRAKS